MQSGLNILENSGGYIPSLGYWERFRIFVYWELNLDIKDELVSTPMINIKKALNKAYLKQKPTREEIDKFKHNLKNLIINTNESESEEHHKNIIIDFLKKTYYSPNHYVNTKGRTDLVIHNGNTAGSSVGVLIETKSPTNKAEMPSRNNLNSKAMQELVLYYLRERITNNNLEVKHLIITNINEWFIFDANMFEKCFARDKKLVKSFEDFEAGRLSGKTTDFFYSNIAYPAIQNMNCGMEYTYFDINNYDKILTADDESKDNKLIPLYKLLSPEHLLKLPFANDSNTLNENFYKELLHLIGLTRVKESGKELINRPKPKDRHSASLLENTIDELDSLDKLSRLPNVSQFGESKEEQLFNVGLELCITWVNRILFLKLLEAQLVSYHNDDTDYEFLSKKKLHNFDDLNSLFFKVLAKQHSDRTKEVAFDFEKVPYLNSSLFEPTEIEHNTLFISNLNDDRQLPIISSTVLRDQNGKRIKGEKSTLDYIFDFLNSYDFSSEGSEDIQEENKTLINASVLGLIFEKINGYKDGSFFTPGFITEYMCRETIRRAVVQKFNEAVEYGMVLKTLDDVYDIIGNNETFTRDEANEIVNSITICDPAVGSGHFLVSALNEVLAIKNDLNILQDRKGRRLKEYEVEVVNDELVITDDEGTLYEYNPKSKESQRVQETIFHEKQTIIENCLFGVDINPNSVKICRLRLWIELLKNAYYKNETELETLPNIDINIKCGNSLISRFAMDVNLKQALKSSKWDINSYRNAVATYRNAKTKEEKREMIRLIDDIKNDFRTEIHQNSPEYKKLKKLEKEQYEKFIAPQMFADQLTPKQKKKLEEDHKKLNKKITAAKQEIEEIKNNKIYTNAFEWRFEFPEVLDDNGDFRGFDVVVGNPPYIDSETMVLNIPNERIYYSNHFKVASGNWDIFLLFIELGNNIIKDDAQISYILPNKLISAGYAKKTRELILNMNLYKLMDFSEVNVFQEASVYPIIIFIEKNTKKEPINIKVFDTNLNVTKKVIDKSLLKLNNEWNILIVKSENVEILNKVFKKNEMNINENIKNTATVSEAYELKKVISDEDHKNTNVKIINTGTIDPYLSLWGLKKMQYIKDGYEKPVVDKKVFNNIFPNRYEYISKNKICIAGMAKRIEAFLDYGECFSAKSTSIITDLEVKSLEFLTGLLNSKLINFILYNLTLTQKMSGGYVNINTSTLNKLPIAQPTEEQESQISDLVNKILAAKKEDPEADTQQWEDEIDHLVYKLYDLTYDEVLIVDPDTPITREGY